MNPTLTEAVEVDTSDAMTLREASEQSGFSVSLLKAAARDGRLEAKRVRRRLARSDGRVSTQTAWVVTQEALDAFVAEKIKPRKRRAKPESDVFERKPKPRTLAAPWNPYPEHWKRRKIPELLKQAFAEFCGDVRAEAGYRKRKRQNREVAM